MEHKIGVEGIKAVGFVDYAAVARAISRRAFQAAVGEAVAYTVHWSNFWLTSFHLQESQFQHFREKQIHLPS